VFIIYAVLAGLIIGVAVGGRLGNLATIHFRWAPLIVIGFIAQVVLFMDAVAERVGDAGPAIYVATTLMVGAAVLRNIRLPGMPLVVLGAISNMAAILANGGFMPATVEAMTSLGKTAPTIYSNSELVADPSLPWLIDRFALPRWLPLANMFSVGDVLLGIGVLVFVVSVMRHPETSTDGGEGPGVEPTAA
jgi:hypothetical protein